MAYTKIQNGAYTPTISNTLNISASSNISSSYQIIDNIVYVKSRISITGNSNTQWTFRITLPISTTNLKAFGYCSIAVPNTSIDLRENGSLVEVSISSASTISFLTQPNIFFSYEIN